MMSLFVFMLLAFAPAASSPPGGSGAIGFLIDVQGDVSVQRLAWHEPWPAPLGLELHAGETIRLKADGSARILCQDLISSWRPPPRTVSGVFQGCPAAAEIIRQRAGQDVLDARTTDSRPTVLTPSNTVVLDPTPWIQWVAVPNTRRYRVAVLDTRKATRPVWGPALVEGTSMRYPGAPLTVGTKYFVRVTADSGLSADGRAFTVAPPDIRRKIDERKHQLKASIPGGDSVEVATAVYLLSQDLRSDALQALDRLVQKNDRPALQLLRAKVLDETGARDATREAFQAVLRASTDNRYPEGEAEAQMGLARLASTNGEAATRFRQAAQLFRKLGENARAEAAEKLSRSKGQS